MRPTGDVLRRLPGRAVYEIGTLVGRHPAIALALARGLGHGEVIDAATDLVVEGYPRSSNTLMVSVVSSAQTGRTVIAHHVHAPAHVIEAARRRIPTIVLVRDPEEAVLELVLVKPALSLRQALRGWIRFYQPLMGVRSRVVVATSEEVESDPGSIVRRVNDRFGTTFAIPSEDHVREGARRIGACWERRSGPGLPLIGRTSGSEPAPDLRRDRLRTEYRSRRLTNLRVRAERLYRTLVAEPVDGV